MLKRLWTWAITAEPVAVLNGVAAFVTGVAAEVRGDVPAGKAGWIAVGWATFAYVTRHLVTPATKP